MPSLQGKSTHWKWAEAPKSTSKRRWLRPGHPSSAKMPLNPVRHDQTRHTVQRPVSVPCQVQPLRQPDLWHQQKDWRGDLAAPGLRPGHHGLALRVHPSLRHQQARPGAAIGKPQAQPAPLLPFAGRDPASAQGLACGRQRDRQPEPVLRPDQRPRVMRTDDDRSLGPDQRCGVEALARPREVLAPDRVGQPCAEPRAGDLQPPCALQPDPGLAYVASKCSMNVSFRALLSQIPTTAMGSVAERQLTAGRAPEPDSPVPASLPPFAGPRTATPYCPFLMEEVGRSRRNHVHSRDYSKI